MNVGLSHHFVIRNDLLTSLLGRQSAVGIAAVAGWPRPNSQPTFKCPRERAGQRP